MLASTFVIKTNLNILASIYSPNYTTQQIIIYCIQFRKKSYFRLIIIYQSLEATNIPSSQCQGVLSPLVSHCLRRWLRTPDIVRMQISLTLKGISDVLLIFTDSAMNLLCKTIDMASAPGTLNDKNWFRLNQIKILMKCVR